jgi:hypothetical protein
MYLCPAWHAAGSSSSTRRAESWRPVTSTRTPTAPWMASACKMAPPCRECDNHSAADFFFLELVITDRLLGYHAQGHGPPTRLCRGRSFLPDTARFQVLLGVDVRPRRYLLRRILVYQPEDFNREWSPRFSTLWGIETAGSEPKRFDI